MLKPVAAAPTFADLELAGLCSNGDTAAQLRLFEAQRQRVHLVLFRILGSNRDLEDLAQEAFVAIYRSLPRYRGEASLNTWVDRITTRVAYRYLSRGTPVGVRLEVVSGQAQDVTPLEEQLYLRDVARRLYGVLDRLAPKYRVAFALHVLDERPLTEVAAITEVSLVAAKSHVWRARRMVERSAKSDSVLKEFLQQQRGTHE